MKQNLIQFAKKRRRRRSQVMKASKEHDDKLHTNHFKELSTVSSNHFDDLTMIWIGFIKAACLILHEITLDERKHHYVYIEKLMEIQARQSH